MHFKQSPMSTCQRQRIILNDLIYYKDNNPTERTNRQTQLPPPPRNMTNYVHAVRSIKKANQITLIRLLVAGSRLERLTFGL